jgi:sarcosine oxidase subunit alpha
MRLWGNLMIKNKRLKFGGRINREQEVSFSFNGKKYKGFQGDTLASALLANGVMVMMHQVII